MTRKWRRDGKPRIKFVFVRHVLREKNSGHRLIAGFRERHERFSASYRVVLFSVGAVNRLFIFEVCMSYVWGYTD